MRCIALSDRGDLEKRTLQCALCAHERHEDRVYMLHRYHCLIYLTCSHAAASVISSKDQRKIGAYGRSHMIADCKESVKAKSASREKGVYGTLQRLCYNTQSKGVDPSHETQSKDTSQKGAVGGRQLLRQCLVIMFFLFF